MLSFSEISVAVRRVLEGASPRFLTIDEVLERLPMRDQLVTQLSRIGDNVGARHAAASMVRDALHHIGAEVQFSFDPDSGPPRLEARRQATPEHVHVVYRMIGGLQ